jgi:hypothetical protein
MVSRRRSMSITASPVQKKRKAVLIVKSIRYGTLVLIKSSISIREHLQGTLLVTLRDSRMPIDENEIQRKFSQFGDIKNIRPVDGRSDQRLVEMYDTRVCPGFSRLVVFLRH